MTSNGADAPTSLARYPAWLRELDLVLPSVPHLVLTGNVHDVHLLPASDDAAADAGVAGRAPMPTVPSDRTVGVLDAVLHVLVRAGYDAVLQFDVARGATVAFDRDGRGASLVDGAHTGDRRGGTRRPDAGDRHPGDPENSADHLVRLLEAVSAADLPCALLVTGAARLSPGNDVADPHLHRAMLVAESLLAAATPTRVPGPHRARLYRPVIWILDRPNELPAWFVGRDRVRVISIPAPNLGARVRQARLRATSLPGFGELGSSSASTTPPSTPPASLSPAQEAVITRFAEAAAGLSLREMAEITRICIDQQVPADRVEDGVRLYRVGVPDNPWHDASLIGKIRDGARTLSGRVLGQPRAIRKALDILIRSTSGLTGAQARGRGSRPQGVLFFAGPTGVGKTELAKSLAELVFGRDDEVVRFDMSEFAQEHTEARLIGAPPGYTGHQAGGELTNAIREKPFSLLLFDEVEKAHPRILDKFLQILDEGRLTDGNGSTVHFTEAILVFTSNLGVYERAPDGRRVPVVSRGAPYPELESRVLASIRRHFTETIGRPELLNRLGDNVVVFDFILDDVARDLVPVFLRNVAARVRDARGCEVTFAPAVVATVQTEALKRLDFGGRGVSTAVETMIVNPLARALLDVPADRRAIQVTAVRERADGWAVDLR